MRTVVLSLLIMRAGFVWAQQPPSVAFPIRRYRPERSKDNAPKGRDAWPEAIEDNSFFIEEAYNQEPGVVQWIFGGLYTFPNKLAALSFTNEWPCPGRLTNSATPFRGQEVDGQPQGYRGPYAQLPLSAPPGEDKNGVAIAPRLSVILPTGDWRKGLGYGTTGWQLSLPASKRISRHFAMHFNAGATAYPSAKWLVAGGTTSRQNLWGTNQGASLIWLASPRINLMLEAVASRAGRILGKRHESSHPSRPGQSRFPLRLQLPQGPVGGGSRRPNRPHRGHSPQRPFPLPIMGGPRLEGQVTSCEGRQGACCIVSFGGCGTVWRPPRCVRCEGFCRPEVQLGAVRHGELARYGKIQFRVRKGGILVPPKPPLTGPAQRDTFSPGRGTG